MGLIIYSLKKDIEQQVQCATILIKGEYLYSYLLVYAKLSLEEHASNW